MLADLGIELNDTDIESLLAHLNETIEEKIGMEITESLDDVQLQELVEMQESASDDELGAWIAKHVPNYMEIVQDNIDIAIGEMVDSADGINHVAEDKK